VAKGKTKKTGNEVIILLLSIAVVALVVGMFFSALRIEELENRMAFLENRVNLTDKELTGLWELFAAMDKAIYKLWIDSGMPLPDQWENQPGYGA